jgi:MoaA/NifB/PqqE/SkfB family radical SAM enzyme
MTEIVEWKPENRYNSFSSVKGLTYFNQYKQIIEWLNGNTNYLPPPVEVNIDPYAECNLSCPWCVGQRYLKTHRDEVGDMRILPTEYLLRLVDFLAQWGCKATCWSGGGEDTLHKGLPQAINRSYERGLDTSVVTNTTNITDELLEPLMRCRWIAMSIDSADRETYIKVKGADKFDLVIKNIQRLVKKRIETNSKVDLAYKMVILPDNYQSLHKACKLAKELGVQDFHIRPVDMERSDIKGHQQLKLDMDMIAEQFMRCHEEETKEFRVYTVTYKFDKFFHNKQDFTRCLATPLLLPILSNGKAFLCVDVKMMKEYELGSAYPNPPQILEWWGSDKHRELIKSIIPSKNCGDRRCTFMSYNEQIEQTVLIDKLCVNFP